ncbi:unnamed protein product [Ixodes pacificus]
MASELAPRLVRAIHNFKGKNNDEVSPPPRSTALLAGGRNVFCLAARYSDRWDFRLVHTFAFECSHVTA